MHHLGSGKEGKERSVGEEVSEWDGFLDLLPADWAISEGGRAFPADDEVIAGQEEGVSKVVVAD